ncbi:MAG: MBL fold metallo-hydrolase [Spirochaetales bacterium]|nr:MBL fold metallo-hydrolase [Spirochaetales bacterium]
MKLFFHGAAQTVTGTQHLLVINGKKILLDCGLFQGKREESYEINKKTPFDASSVDILVLSHAHIDHSGNIPRLVKNGFRGDIICTYATRDLCSIMLRDSAHIQEQDIIYANKKRAEKNLPPFKPLYIMDDAVESLKYFLGMGYNRTREIAPGISLTFFDAGHILGSAFVVLDFVDEDEGKQKRLVFSGDLGRVNKPIIRDPEKIDGANILIIESTYGDRVHEESSASEGRLKDIILKTINQGGKVIVPSFAVGRTQELVYSIHQLINTQQLPAKLPVYVDSPLACDATGIFRLHPEVWDTETQQLMNESPSHDPFGFERMQYTRTAAESKRLNDLKEPAVIISASGMAETGRILHHLKNNCENEHNTILFVGYQAENTLGRRISTGEKDIKIFGEEYHVRAKVEKIDGFSAHADKNEMLSWMADWKKIPEHAFVVHGEETAAFSFKKELENKGFGNVSVPARGDMATA